MEPRLIDIHTHAQFSAFDGDRDAVIRRALDAEIWMINVGTDKNMSQGAIKLAQKYGEGVYATAGLHPNDYGEGFDYDFYKKLVQDPKVVAIGECGLDYYRTAQHEAQTKQKEIFVKHIQLARDVKKPLMIHCREAFGDLIDILRASRFALQAPGIVHFFSGTIEDAQKLMDLGFSFSFGGVITFTSEYEKLIKFIPLDHILLETDAPYVAPIPHRGKRNEPSYIEEVAKKISKILGKDFDEIAEITTKNAIKIFGLS